MKILKLNDKHELIAGEDNTASAVSQQITIPHFSAVNPSVVRHIQVTNAYILIRRYGSETVGIHIDDLVQLFADKFPESSFPPYFTKQPQAVVVIKQGETAILTVEVKSEYATTETFQWQQFDGKEWKNCDGQTTASLSTNAAGKYRCLATNPSGTSDSNEYEVRVIAPATK